MRTFEVVCLKISIYSCLQTTLSERLLFFLLVCCKWEFSELHCGTYGIVFMRYINNTDITFPCTPYPHMHTCSSCPAPSRCSLHVYLPHNITLKGVCSIIPRLINIKSSCWSGRLTVKWLIGTIPTVIRETALIFLQLVSRNCSTLLLDMKRSVTSISL